MLVWAPVITPGVSFHWFHSNIPALLFISCFSVNYRDGLSLVLVAYASACERHLCVSGSKLQSSKEELLFKEGCKLNTTAVSSVFLMLWAALAHTHLHDAVIPHALMVQGGVFDRKRGPGQGMWWHTSACRACMWNKMEKDGASRSGWQLCWLFEHEGGCTCVSVGGFSILQLRDQAWTGSSMWVNCDLAISLPGGDKS